MFFNAGLQGFAIGCLSGFGIGLVTTFYSRRFMTIPFTMLGSGVFFAGVMSFGSLIHSADHQFMKEQHGDIATEEPSYLYVMAVNKEFEK